MRPFSLLLYSLSPLGAWLVFRPLPQLVSGVVEAEHLLEVEYHGLFLSFWCLTDLLLPPFGLKQTKAIY